MIGLQRYRELNFDLLPGITRPDSLFHYTNANSFLSILKNKCFWATDARYMDDRNELNHGQELIVQCIDSYVKSNSHNQDTVKLLNSVRDRLVNFVSDFSFFIVSLSTDSDSIYHWLEYADNANGLSLEIFLPVSFNDNIYLRKIVYDDSEKIQLVNKILSYYCITPHVVKVNANEILSHLTTVLLECIYIFKKCDYKKEKEIRLVCVMKNSSDVIDYRNNNNKIIPFVRLSLVDNSISACNEAHVDTTFMQIKGIKLGKISDIELSKKTLKSLVNKHNQTVTNISISKHFA